MLLNVTEEMRIDLIPKKHRYYVSGDRVVVSSQSPYMLSDKCKSRTVLLYYRFFSHTVSAACATSVTDEWNGEISTVLACYFHR